MKSIIYNDDGWSSYMRYPAPMTPDDIERVTVGPVAGTAVRVYQFCSLGGHAVNYTSSFLPRVGEAMARVDTLHVWRMRTTLRHLDESGTDPLKIVSAACHQAGIACQFSLRMNDAHHTYKKPDGSWYFPELLSPWFDAHTGALLPSGQLDYACSDVHSYRIAQIDEVLSRYDVDGIDLDFTRFRPWFAPGHEKAGMPRMTDLVRRLRDATRRASKSLGARFEYDPKVCIESGLDVETWLSEGLLDQVTLGGVGDHTPDAPSDWWVQHAHARSCSVFPGMEGQLHWMPGSGGGGAGTHPGDGVSDGFGPPSLAYMRAVAANHYASGADGVSLFNFTCADGPFERAALTELADPAGLRLKDKQYVLAVWPADAQIYYAPWSSRFRLEPDASEVTYPIRIADNVQMAIARGIAPRAVLTLDLMGVNHLDDLAMTVNGVPITWTGYAYNHYDHGCWNDLLTFDVPPGALSQGPNQIMLKRLRDTPGFEGAVEVRKCILDVQYPAAITPGQIVR
ncbi:MAG: hypothetical protein M1546_26265 [Chloroflexi bacterium]|nr:hypothetical protein [Chloroflexota bacterium]